MPIVRCYVMMNQIVNFEPRTYIDVLLTKLVVTPLSIAHCYELYAHCYYILYSWIDTHISPVMSSHGINGEPEDEESERVSSDYLRIIYLRIFFIWSFPRVIELCFTEMTGKDSNNPEYNDALLKVVHDHDEEPKGVPVGVNIQVSHARHVTKCFT